MITAYFWKKGKCVEYSESPTIGAVKAAGLSDYPCVDLTCEAAGLRYGLFAKEGWQSIPYANMPKELLAHVLLLT